MATTAPSIAPGGDVFGQPRGLWVLAGTELWDRISFHGMQAMLVLYMTGDLLVHPERVRTILGFGAYRHAVEAMTGPLTDVALATQTFGFYLAFVTGLPLLGGWVGDKFTGRKLAVGLGAAMMTAGHFFLAFDPTFLVALVLLMFGAGFLRGNLSAQIKSLYADGDPRESNAFQYYYFAVNFGAFIAPIVTTTVAVVMGYGWHAGFAVAGFGMLIGLLVYVLGARFLPADAGVRLGRDAAAAPRQPLTAGEKRRIWGLFAIWPISVAFWTAQSQIWNVYNVWVQDHIDMHVGSFQMPVPWLQSLDGLAPAVFTPITLWIWARMALKGREPDEFVKLSFGVTLFGVAVAMLATEPLLAGSGKGPVLLPVMFHVVSNFAAVWFAPVMLALFATRAPGAWRGTLIGINSLAVSAASLISGRMGSLYERVSPSEFWLINAAVCFAAGALVLVARGFYKRMLARENAEDIGPLPPKEEIATDPEGAAP
ncbi:peptide MFS transporter [Parablastomonas sp. CN1-191]|uniref:peptide MFS transporter n=1 Tax=Parablastomonas sp. CN1-191 TaxID=3400908 RepID=UPI003BF8FFC1